MDNTVIESAKIKEEEETPKQENGTEEENTPNTTAEKNPVNDQETKKLVSDAKTRRKDEKIVQQILKSLDNLKTPRDKLTAMCKKYAELLHENRQLQATVKLSEKNINVIHREKEQVRQEMSKALLAKMKMEQLCRELQKLNKAQQEETALKLRVAEEKRKHMCITFERAFAEMNTLNSQNDERSAKMREENLEMREKIKSVREGIELTETQLEKARQQSRLELELAEKKYLKATLELTAEKETLMEDKRQLLMKLAHYHVCLKEHVSTESFLRQQIAIYEEKMQAFNRDVKRATESLKNFRPESREMTKKMLKVEKETALWKQRWEKTHATVLQITKLKEQRDAEMAKLKNQFTALQELCKAFQRERTSLIAQLKEKNDGVERKIDTDEHLKSMKQVEKITEDCEKLKENLTKLEGSLSEKVREAFRVSAGEDQLLTDQENKTKSNKKSKNEARKKSGQKKQESNALSSNEALEIDGTGEEKSDLEKTDSGAKQSSNNVAVPDPEIPIYERHENVIKDFEKVLAEQATLEAKIAQVKEMSKSLENNPNALKMENKISELSQIPELSNISMDSDEPEIQKLLEAARDIEVSGAVSDRLGNSEGQKLLEKPDASIGPVECNTETKKSSLMNIECLEELSKTVAPLNGSKAELSAEVDETEEEKKSKEDSEMARMFHLTSMNMEKNISEIEAFVSSIKEAEAEASTF